MIVTGAQQTGKSTLARELTLAEHRYLSLDDLHDLDVARRGPDALLDGTQPITLDEVQREPDLLNAVKRAIDRRCDPGRFLLTGSANLLLALRRRPRAGRVTVTRLNYERSERNMLRGQARDTCCIRVISPSG